MTYQLTYPPPARWNRDDERPSRRSVDYRVRVRSTTLFLWGSAGLTTDITFPNPLFFHIRNELFGDVLTFGTQTSGGTTTTIGTLNPGECCSIPIQSICGVFATCPTDTTVTCHIRGAV